MSHLAHMPTYLTYQNPNCKVYLSLQRLQEEGIKFGRCASDYRQKVMQHSDWLIQFTVNNFSCVSIGSISGHIVSYFSICSVVVESKCFGSACGLLD